MNPHDAVNDDEQFTVLLARYSEVLTGDDLDLGGTKVTAKGVAELHKLRPDLKIERS